MINVQDTVTQPYMIDNDQKADAAIRRIAEEKEECERFCAFYRQQIERVQASTAAKVERIEMQLLEYFATVPHRETRTQSKYNLPSGELIMQKAHVDYARNNERLLAWCKENAPQYIKTTEAPAWDKIKAYIKETGDLPDGVEIVETPEQFKVR